MNAATWFLATTRERSVAITLSFPTTLLEYFVLTSGRFEQCLILTADTLISIAHHFSRHERFTVEYTQVVLDDLSLDVVKGKVDITYFRTLAFALFPFTSQSVFGILYL